MRNMAVTFDDDDFKKLEKKKTEKNLTWRQLIMTTVGDEHSAKNL